MGEGLGGLSKLYIKRAISASLSRLNTDYFDVYLSHFPDHETPIEDTLSCYATLLDRQQIFKIGASNYSGAELQHALDISSSHGLPRYEIFQPGYSLVERHHYETEYQQICVQNELSVITYFSLAAGFLSGKYRNRTQLKHSARQRQLERYFSEQGLQILNCMDGMKDKYQADLSEIALAWSMAQPSITAPIASATSITQLDALYRATQVKLADEDIHRLNMISQYE